MIRHAGLVLGLLLGPSLASAQVSSGTGFAIAPGLVVTNHYKITIQRGFCTGRRLHAWLEALDHDLAKASVAKKTTLDRYFAGSEVFL